ncbi:MAG: hypothetical protein Q8O67_01980 [Deltaproteobacteria bacterium]|nr:hypothetical protein [Deltaproteobacteria bacterium]
MIPRPLKPGDDERCAYALPLVLVVLSLLMLAMMSLFTTIATATQSNREALRSQRGRIECEGLSRVATAQLLKLSSPTKAEIEAKLRDVAAGATADGFHGVKLTAEIRDTGTISTVAAGTLAGLPFLEQIVATRLEVDDGDDSCRAIAEQPVASLAVTQFGLYSPVSPDHGVMCGGGGASIENGSHSQCPTI